jgi:hypothetical protein
VFAYLRIEEIYLCDLGPLDLNHTFSKAFPVPAESTTSDEW